MDGKKVDRILDIYTRLLSGKKVNLKKSNVSNCTWMLLLYKFLLDNA